MKKYLIIFIGVVFLVTAGYFYVDFLNKKNYLIIEKENNITKFKSEENSSDLQESKKNQKIDENLKKTEEPVAQISQKTEQEVPFIVQAPFGNWKEKNFQNGCEEASMIMAMAWVKKISEISAHDSQKQIEDIINFENKKLGYSADTDVFDMQKVFQEYFKHKNTEVRENINIEDIKNELQKGNIVLIPVFGRALGNPNYTPPGPITHMLVIIGYDPATKKIITNDSGTKKGKSYQYSENILFNAIWKYPGGKDHPDPPKGLIKKAMLVVKP